MTKLLAVLGILALCATAFATDAIGPTMPDELDATVSLAIDGYASMTFGDADMHIHLTPIESTTNMGGTSNGNALHMAANFDYEVTAVLDEPEKLVDGVSTIAGTWTLNAPLSTSSTSDLEKVYTQDSGDIVNDTLTVSVAGVDFTDEWGDYLGGSVTVTFVALP